MKLIYALTLLALGAGIALVGIWLLDRRTAPPANPSEWQETVDAQQDLLERQQDAIQSAVEAAANIERLAIMQRNEVKRIAAIKDSLVRAWQTQHDAQYTAFRRMQVAAESEVQLISKLQKQLHDAGFYLNATGDTVPSVRLVAPTHLPSSTRD